MKNNELIEIIGLIEANASDKKAVFGVYSDEQPEAEHFIKANKHGLLLFAVELLKAAEKSQIETQDPHGDILIENQVKLIDDNSEIIIRHIKLIDENYSVPEVPVYEETIVDKLLPLGCVLIFIFLIIALITGIITIGKQVVR